MPFLALVIVNGVRGCNGVRSERTGGGRRSRHMGGWRWAGVMKRDIWAGRQLYEYAVDVRPCVKRMDSTRPIDCKYPQASPRPRFGSPEMDLDLTRSPSSHIRKVFDIPPPHPIMSNPSRHSTSLQAVSLVPCHAAPGLTTNALDFHEKPTEVPIDPSSSTATRTKT